MAQYYGTTYGNRGVATRCGTTASGITSSVQSYDGSVITRLQPDVHDDNKTKLSISTADYSTAVYGDQQFYGTIEDFKYMCKLYKAIEEGKLKIVGDLEDA